MCSYFLHRTVECLSQGLGSTLKYPYPTNMCNNLNPNSEGGPQFPALHPWAEVKTATRSEDRLHSGWEYVLEIHPRCFAGRKIQYKACILGLADNIHPLQTRPILFAELSSLTEPLAYWYQTDSTVAKCLYGTMIQVCRVLSQDPVYRWGGKEMEEPGKHHSILFPFYFDSMNWLAEYLE